MEQPSLPNGAPQPSPGERAIVAPGGAPQPRQGEQSQGPMPERGGEHFVQPQGGGPAQATAAQPVAPPPVQPVAQADASTKASDDDHPQFAEDVDVIEKEWIDKAKQIVNETRDDPRAQERKVSELQSVYLKKRYGKDIGVSED